MTLFAIAAIGEDRPGIVAAISAALLDAGASIEDSSMTILGEQFAMLLLVEAAADAAGLEQVLARAARDLSLTISVTQTEHAHGVPSASGAAHVVSAYGPDQRGLVTALATVLADAGVNITNFGSRLGSAGTFAMWFNVDLPPVVDAATLAERLRAAGGEVDLQVSVHPVEIEEF